MNFLGVLAVALCFAAGQVLYFAISEWRDTGPYAAVGPGCAAAGLLCVGLLLGWAGA